MKEINTIQEAWDLWEAIPFRSPDQGNPLFCIIGKAFYQDKLGCVITLHMLDDTLKIGGTSFFDALARVQSTVMKEQP